MMTCVDLDLFYGKAIFGRMCALIGKTGTQPLTENKLPGNDQIDRIFMSEKQYGRQWVVCLCPGAI